MKGIEAGGETGAAPWSAPVAAETAVGQRAEEAVDGTEKIAPLGEGLLGYLDLWTTRTEADDGMCHLLTPSLA
jgi:hypothetical protein